MLRRVSIGLEETRTTPRYVLRSGKTSAREVRADSCQAFTNSSFRSADRAARRTAEKDQQRLHVPLVNRNPEERKVTGEKGKGMDEGSLPPPPIIVGIVGPPGVGKSTLLRSLVRRFTKHNLQEPQGPVTVVSGKTRRITFIECGNDLNSMVDLGKVVDLVLLMIDGSFGFEMVCWEETTSSELSRVC